MASIPSTTRLLKYLVSGAGLAAIAILLYTQVIDPSDTRQASTRQDGPVQQQPATETRGSVETSGHADTKGVGWTVGELRPNGLRIKPSGRSDASAVLDPSQFDRTEVRRAYRIATEVPEVLNKLYCWCGCENRGVHRSNLGCFEDEMAVNCAVCRGTAEIASRMTTDGISDPGRIQAAVDDEWGPQ